MTTFASRHAADSAASHFADKVQMQHKLFSELSRMFGAEVPLYDKSLLVNKVCNQTVCKLLAQTYIGFSVAEGELEKTSGERHGAIRIGRPDEYRWVGRFFAQFAMEPHNFYDMTNVGSKSQPIIATAFRSRKNPEHRVFTSLLMPDYYDDATRERIQATVAKRQVFSDHAKELIEKGERQDGLDWRDADELIREATDRIFKWTGRAHDYRLYKDLCDAGFKIAADIVCFERHHLNHLTPNTCWMNLYTAAMEFCMGDIGVELFRLRATLALQHLAQDAGPGFVHLTFKHLSFEQIASFKRVKPGAAVIEKLVKELEARLRQSDLELDDHDHAGFKEFTEGPPVGIPIFLRQDSYKALTEPVAFSNDDGSVIYSTHTARFGEIEQRFFACTPKGRALYDGCLAEADAARERDPDLPNKDFVAYEELYGKPFEAFPRTLVGLLEKGLAFARFWATPKGIESAGSIQTTDVATLIRDGLVGYEGQRYEDFLPVSAAGIFASNLSQYGTKSTAHVRPTYSQAQLEEVLGRKIIDANAEYAAVHAKSLLETYGQLGLQEKLPAGERAELESQASGA